jgi:O-acetyl-ADP-ribose deacetylase (regulator of RNase III)
MSLYTSVGDLLALAEEGHFDIIVHGCNCQNVMGSGIAKQIKDKYPGAYQADTEMDNYSVRRYDKLGNYTMVDTGKFMVVNAYTQFKYLPRGIDHFEYASFAVILQKLAHYYGSLRFGLPYIGMGLAGGDSERIMSIIEEFAKLVHEKNGTVTLVEYQP